MAANDGGPDLPANAPVDGDADAGGPYIPAELVPDIAKHLTSLHDFFALRAGCRAYRAALPKCRALLALQPPHLLVPHTADPSLPLFKLLEPGCAAFSLALFHTPDRRLLRFRALLELGCIGAVGAVLSFAGVSLELRRRRGAALELCRSFIGASPDVVVLRWSFAGVSLELCRTSWCCVGALPEFHWSFAGRRGAALELCRSFIGASPDVVVLRWSFAGVSLELRRTSWCCVGALPEFHWSFAGRRGAALELHRTSAVRHES